MFILTMDKGRRLNDLKLILLRLKKTTDVPLQAVNFLSFFVIYISECEIALVLNFLKPTGYVMHQQFNIQQLYALPTLYLCVLYLSENKQRLVLLTT